MSEAASSLILAQGRKAGAWTFGLLFLIESLARAVTSGMLSMQAYDLLGAARQVSILSIVVSGTVLVITLLMPLMFGRMRRRWAYTMGCVGLIAGSAALATFSLPGQILGMILRNAGAAVLNVTLQLYILDHIKKADLTSSEPLRLALSTIAWVGGPFSGVWLYQHYGPVAPQLAAGCAALVLLAVFWRMRLSDPDVLPPGNLAPFNPLGNVAHFIAQPRLRLAWLIAFARSTFWAALFTYGPLMMIEGGAGKTAGGILLSLSQFLLLAAVVYGRAAKSKGVRLVISACFVGMCVASLMAGGIGTTAPFLAGALLLIGAGGASGVDAIGAIPYLRAVKFHERQRMTAVYRTFLELSDLLPSMVYAVALQHADVSIVFVLMGLFAGVVSLITWRFLPKGM